MLTFDQLSWQDEDGTPLPRLVGYTPSGKPYQEPEQIYCEGLLGQIERNVTTISYGNSKLSKSFFEDLTRSIDSYVQEWDFLCGHKMARSIGREVRWMMGTATTMDVFFKLRKYKKFLNKRGVIHKKVRKYEN